MTHYQSLCELAGSPLIRNLKDAIRSFDDAETADVYYGSHTKAARRLPKPLWPVIRQKLEALHRAQTLQALRPPAGNRLEALKGDRIGCFSVRVNEQFRITFQSEGRYADAVTCEDYH